MRFTFDNQNQTVTAHKSMGEAARFVLHSLGLAANSNEDYVKLALSRCADDGRFSILTVSQAFASVAVSENAIAQELAEKFERAVNELYS